MLMQSSCVYCVDGQRVEGGGRLRTDIHMRKKRKTESKDNGEYLKRACRETRKQMRAKGKGKGRWGC